MKALPELPESGRIRRLALAGFAIKEIAQIVELPIYLMSRLAKGYARRGAAVDAFRDFAEAA